MNDLCADIGFKSINHCGEQLCGDHVDIVERDENSTVIVLADGLGSGVKASILSTLTSKIISTMMAEGLPIEECVSTIAATLPVCSVRGVAYSTFTIIHLINNETAELMETIRFIKDPFDMTILLIEHDMKLVAGICEEITVLNFGKELMSGTPSVVLNSPEVITAYLGE